MIRPPSLFARCLLGLLTLGIALPVFADAPCTVEPLDKYRFLRRLSLDVRGRLPSWEEYQQVDALPDVPAQWLESWLAGPEFLQVARGFHEALLWPDITNVAMSDVTVTLAQDKTTGIWAVQSSGRRKLWRKGTGSELCGNWPQKQFDAAGLPLPVPVTDATGKVLYQQDGWVEVTPYWAPDQKVQVCAFDAIAATTGQKQDCATRAGTGDPGCGCGPNLQWCYGPNVQTLVEQEMREQFLRAVDDAVTGQYQALLTSAQVWLDGRLEFWRKNLAPMSTPGKTWNMPAASDPPLATQPSWLDTTWHVATRSGQHSGILTLPAWSLRFQTNRGRANHFRIVFEDQYFVPPASTIDTNCVPSAPDLTQACVCRNCHQVVEPLAAYFAAVTEAGSTLVTDAEMPPYDPKCDPAKTKTPSPYCQRFYATDPKAARPGWRMTHQWANLSDPLHQKIAANLAEGPGGIAKNAIDSGAFATSTVRNLWRVLMHRDVLLDPLDAHDETALLTQLAAQLQTSGNFRGLVQALVQLPQYRRVR